MEFKKVIPETEKSIKIHDVSISVDNLFIKIVYSEDNIRKSKKTNLDTLSSDTLSVLSNIVYDSIKHELGIDETVDLKNEIKERE